MSKITLRSVQDFAQGFYNILNRKQSGISQIIEQMYLLANMYQGMEAKVAIGDLHFYMRVRDLEELRVEAGHYSLNLVDGDLSIGGLPPTDERFDDYRNYLLSALKQLLGNDL